MEFDKNNMDNLIHSIEDVVGRLGVNTSNHRCPDDPQVPPPGPLPGSPQLSPLITMLMGMFQQYMSNKQNHCKPPNNCRPPQTQYHNQPYAVHCCCCCNKQKHECKTPKKDPCKHSKKHDDKEGNN